MRVISLTFAGLLLHGCGNDRSHEWVADAQAKSEFGPTAKWNVDAAIDTMELQRMRDRAYAYCLAEKQSDQTCFRDQDHSLFEYARSFALVRIYRSEAQPTFSFAVAHKQEPSAFDRLEQHCRSIYEDQGERDARSLGPCLSAAVGADFFGVVPVP